MKPKNYEVLMDIYMGVLNAPAIQFTTEDFGMCQITFSLLEDRITPYNLSNCLVRMVINGQQQDCTISDANNGKAEIVLLQSMFSEVGPVFAELQIYDATNQTMRLTTPTFKYTVRKSLMDDNTVQADPNYSILQNMILEVSSADEVAKQAKKTAESAMATANQAESKANQIMSNGDYAKEQGDYAKAEGDRLQGMLTLDGNAQTNFDFIENKVVQDGLIYENRVVTNRVNSGIILTNNFTISMTLSASSKTDNQYFLGNYSDSRGLYLFCNNGVIKLIIDTIALDTIKPEPNEFYNVSIVCIEGECSVFINGIKYTHTVRYVPNNIRLAFGGYNGSSGELGTGKLKNVLIYNLPLAPQEIQNNFSVLNNLPSIKELHTTDSTGKTSILKFASDTDHVEDRSGRTQDQINRTFYKRMCKEIPSPNGEPITVKNGEEGYVLSAEIKGQTVRNEFYALPGNIRFSNGMMVLANTISGVQQSQNATTFNKCIGILKPDTVYSVVLDVIETNYTQPMVFGVGNTVDIDVSTTGIKVGKFTTPSSVTGDTLITLQNKVADRVAGRKIAFKFGFYEGDLTIKNPIKSTQFGLSSTQAIISNNGEKYTIYHPTELNEDGSKKVISLGGVGNVKDALEILEDGSAIWIDASNSKTFNGFQDENWNNGVVDKNEFISFGMPLIGAKSFPNNTIAIAKCNRFELDTTTNIYGALSRGVCINQNSWVYVSISKNELATQDVQGFKIWLQSNPLTLEYQLAEPTITHIPKELVPTILTHKTNILEVGGAVKPSSFKVTVPVDKLAEIEARLQALENTTVDVVLNK